MCGIAGMMTRDPAGPAPATLAAMAAALAHRGPDGSGTYVQGNVGLVHTRLAIIDLAGGDQPLHGPQGLALIANGEIYNYIELKAGMAGTRFATGSDCEPPLHLYASEGLGALDRLRGMYAMALHAPTAGRLILARDPFGIKPLYYAAGPDGLAFASEPQALLAAGFGQRRLLREHLAELLQLQFTTGQRTIFEGIERVLPGETLVIGEGQVVDRQLRAALPAGEPVDWSEEEALAALDRALIDSVTVHERADVPYGLFLSGGIDSAVVLAAMARIDRHPVRAFTVGFPESRAADERAAAAAMAKSVGAEHVEIAFGRDDFWRLLPAVAAAMDDPAADYACLPSYKLAAAARAGGLKVVLSGEGGDELFAGYGRYRDVLRPWWRGGRAMRRRGIFDGLEVLREDVHGWRDGIAAAEATAAVAGRDRLQVAQATDCADWLPNDLLAKLDRCLMANGIEGRTPFLDPVVADLAFRLPDRLKVRGRSGKWLLRRWLEKHLPAAQPFARKQGFTVPVGEWIASEGEALGELVARTPGVAEIAQPEAVRRLFRNAASKRAGLAAWTLLFYALWHRRHILGLLPEGDAVACLADLKTSGGA